MRIIVVSSIAIPETVSLSWLQFEVSHSTTYLWPCSFNFTVHFLRTGFLSISCAVLSGIMNDVELKARKAAVDFINARFTDLESLDRVKGVHDDVYKVHETCRKQLDEQVMLGFGVSLALHIPLIRGKNP